MSHEAPQAGMLRDILHCLPPAVGAQPNGRSRHAERSLLIKLQPKLGAQQGHQAVGCLGAAWKERVAAEGGEWGMEQETGRDKRRCAALPAPMLPARH